MPKFSYFSQIKKQSRKIHGKYYHVLYRILYSYPIKTVGKPNKSKQTKTTKKANTQKNPHLSSDFATKFQLV